MRLDPHRIRDIGTRYPEFRDAIRHLTDEEIAAIRSSWTDFRVDAAKRLDMHGIGVMLPGFWRIVVQIADRVLTPAEPFNATRAGDEFQSWHVN